MSEKNTSKTEQKTASKSKTAAVVSKPITKKSAKDGLSKSEQKSNSRISKEQKEVKAISNSRIPKDEKAVEKISNSRIPKEQKEQKEVDKISNSRVTKSTKAKNTPQTPQKTSSKKAEPKSKENKEQSKAQSAIKKESSSKTASKAKNSQKEQSPQKELFRTKSGHLVRSKSEVIIADYLYGEQICFAYEKRLPIEAEARCDFYVPACCAYIEYWGTQSDEAERKKYEKRKKEKIALYKAHALNLIEIDDKSIKNLEDFLQKELLKLGLKVFK